MSDQESTFKKFRDADDAGGNLAWSSKMGRKALKHAQDAPPFVEDWELSDGEKVVWRLLKIPRKYMDLENTGVLPAEKARSFLRGLVSAEVVDVLEQDQAKPIVPIEIKRLAAKVKGGDAGPSKPTGRLKARVYRPDISGAAGQGAAPQAEAKPEPAPEPAPAPKPAPAPVAAAPASSEPLTGRVKEMADLVEQKHAAMRNQDHYQFLDIQRSAQPDGIRKAYMKLAKELHPDRFAGSDLPADVLEKADALFKRLQNAWSTLSNEGQKKQYDQGLASGMHEPVEGGKVRRPEEGKVMFLKAEHLAKTKNWQQAERHYKTALQLDDQIVDARVGLAWAIFFNDARDKNERSTEAKHTLEDIVREHRHGDAAYKLALIARLEGNTDEHEKRIVQATKLSPNHREALQERRIIERRKGGSTSQPPSKAKGSRAAGEKKGGFFSRKKR